MSEPVVFISRFQLKPGTLDAYRQFSAENTALLEADKPRTLVFLMYLNENATRVSIVHAFADSASMDLHFEGATERARAAYEFLLPEGWEVYGKPSEQALITLQQAASAAGVSLTLWPKYGGGFIRAG